MSNQKILEFNGDTPSPLFRFMQKLGAEKGGLECVHHTEFSEEHLKDATLAFFSFAKSRELLPQLRVLPSLVRLLECFDAYQPEDKKWYPRLFMYEALRKILVERARDLDNRAPAFIVGEGEEARVAASVCVNLGVSEIYLIDESATSLQEEARLLSRGHLGVQFKLLPIEELTIQAISASLVINTTNLQMCEALLNDLSYFNFMKTGGYAVDCYMGNMHSTLLEEAERAELKVLKPSEILQALVEIVLEKLGKSDLITRSELAKMIDIFTQENSSSV